MENCIIVDWFAMTFRQKGISIYEIIQMLGLPEYVKFIEFPGRYCYRNRLSFGHINIYYNHYREENDFPLLEMSGQGCREFESFSSYSIDYLLEIAKDTKNYHMSRLDIAYDDRKGVLDINKIMLDGFRQNFVTNSAKVMLTDEICQHLNGFSLTTGSKSSDMYMRIYDKARERGFVDGRHWVRCELVLKQDRATQFILSPEPLGVKYRGVIHNYFRFVSPSKSDTNKRRWKMRRYWLNFLENVHRITVYSRKDVDYNLSHLHNYVFGQSGNSIFTYVKCLGLSVFLENLLEHNSKPNGKQRLLIEECKLLYEQGQEISYETVKELSEKFNL